MFRLVTQDASWALCRPSGTRLINLILPGTDVPGYRLLRPYGTVSVAVFESAQSARAGDNSGVTSNRCTYFKVFCHQSNSEDRDRVGWPDHQGWQVDSPVVTSSRNQCIG